VAQPVESLGDTADPLEGTEDKASSSGDLSATPRPAVAPPNLQEYTIRSIAFGLNPLTGRAWVADDFNLPGAEHGVQST